MSASAGETYRRILIASANPLFAKGLQKMMMDHRAKEEAEIRLAGNTEEATRIMTEWKPELVIVDYDDRSIKRAAFLDHFISGNGPLQVMLISLKASGEVIVYDRRAITPDQAGDWLDLSQL